MTNLRKIYDKCDLQRCD